MFDSTAGQSEMRSPSLFLTYQVRPMTRPVTIRLLRERFFLRARVTE
jgi:hypothetical protein